MSARTTLLLLSLPFALLSQPTRTVLPVRVAQAAGVVVYGCKLYDQNGNCLGCTRDQYLQGAACVDVPDERLIPNCNIYASISACLECDSGLVPAPGGASCVTGNPSLNCEIYSDSTTCKSCPAGAFFSGSGCTLIEHCAAASGQTCALCEAGYYPATGTAICTPVAASVANCTYYSGERICSACAPGLVLASNGTACLSASAVGGQVDVNCAETRVNGDNVCMLCREGHYLKNGVCETCGSPETCFVCDPDSPNRCVICMPGYFQNATNGTCVQNVADSLGQRDPLGSGASLRAALTGALLLLLIEVLG